MPNVHSRQMRTPLGEIEAFVEVAAAGSFSSAAKLLNITHSSLSRKVAHLEQVVGKRLLERTATGVRLTDVGTVQFARFRQAMHLIDSTLSQVSTDGMPTVRISVLESFAIFWLFPRSKAIREEMAGVNIRYDIDARVSDFSDGTEIAVRYGLGKWPSCRAIRLHDINYVPMAGLELAANLGPEVKPEALLACPIINLRSEAPWAAWFEDRGITYKLRPQDQVFPSLSTVIAAVENNMGIGLSREPIDTFVGSKISAVHLPFKKAFSAFGFYLVIPDKKPLSVEAKRLVTAILHAGGSSENMIADFLAN